MNRIVVATLNTGKYEEIQGIMQGIPVDWIAGGTLKNAPRINETGKTYLENATKKALGFSRIFNMTALADDSGLEIDALGGLPGIKSNRYFGEKLSDKDKLDKLLNMMVDVETSHRTARFRCVAVLANTRGVLFSAEATVDGYILKEPIGQDGFGYDPIFWYKAENKSFAEIPRSVKSKISHRGIAMRIIRDFLLRFQCES